MEYQCQANLNIYDSPKCDRLATQASIGRYLRILESLEDSANLDKKAITIELCEDDYPGWLAISDLDKIELAQTSYQSQIVSAIEIQSRFPEAIAFTHKAMNAPNHYLWGGTVGPNYDCSGLMQTAFASVGIWIPRDAYQQEAFVESIDINKKADIGDRLKPGDLVFFGSAQKATHVGLYLGGGRYIHSSGKEEGRDGIGIDILSDMGDEISRVYYQKLRSAGRIVTSYQPIKKS